MEICWRWFKVTVKKKKNNYLYYCCNSGNQSFEHWLLECPMFNYHRSKYLCLTDTSLNNINLNSNDNLLNDNSNL